MDQKKEEAKEEVELKFEPKTVRPEDSMDPEYALLYDPDDDDDGDDDVVVVKCEEELKV